MTNFLRMARALVALVPLVVGCVAEEPVHPLTAGPPMPIVTPPPPPEEGVVYLRGEFSQPGRYLIVGPAHVLEAVDAAGGLTPIADQHVILSRRLLDGRLDRRVVATDDVRAGLVADPALEPEDVIDAIGLH